MGASYPETLLLHASALNADTIDDLARMFTSRGHAFVTLDRALEDPAYQSADTYTGPAGMTWLHRWAITAGMRARPSSARLPFPTGSTGRPGNSAAVFDAPRALL